MKKFLISICLLVGFAFAQESSGFVEEDAHVHGAALLNIAQEADTLFVEFISPSFNIVGFEYQPSSDEEKMMVSNALTDLEQGLMLFAPNASAGCTLSSVSVESEIAEDGHDHDEHSHGEEEHHDHSEEHDHGEEEHHDEDKDHAEDEHHEGEHSEEEHHDHGEEGEHAEDEHHEGEHAEGEEHDHDHEETDVHSEFHGSYEFTCNNADQLSSLDLKGLFIFYPAIEDLDVQYALESGQGAAELNAENSMLNF